LTADLEPKPIEPTKQEEFIYLTIDRYRPAASKTLYAKTKGAAQQSQRQSYYNQQPTNEGLLSEQDLKKSHPNCYDGFKDPLSEDDKRILHENFRREPGTRRALEFLAEFTLGERTELAMRPTKSFATQAREDAEVALLNEDPANLDLLDELAGIDEACNLNDNLTAMFISGRHFGRAVLVKQYDENHIPIRLIPLASVKLGKVYVDSETWELIGIEYKDYQGEKRIIRTEDMIHYEASDYHISPNSRYFGLSDSEPVMHIAAGLRITNEVAVPEMRTEGWAPLDILQFPDIASQEKLNELRDSIKPGKRLILGKGSVIHTEIKMQGDLEKTLKSIEESTKDILRAYGVPLVVAFQDEQNRATAGYALNQMKVSVLEKHRTKLRNTLEPQWYIPNLRALMRKRYGESAKEPSQEETEGIIPALERSARILELDPETLELPFKPKMIFRDKSFDSFLEKSAALLGWLNAGALTIPMALELADLDKQAEEMKTEIANRKMQIMQTMPVSPETSPEASQPTSNTTNSAIPNFPINRNPGPALGGSSYPKNKNTKNK
jgi:hypothetical protein